MNGTRMLTILLFAAVLAVVGAAVVLFQQQARVTSGSERTYLLADLRANLNRVSAIRIETPDSRIHMAIEGEPGDEARWVITTEHGYPADPARVRELVLALTAMEQVEEKTRDRAQYGRLGLDDIDTEGSKATRVSVHDAGGQSLSDVLIGYRAPSRATPDPRSPTRISERAFVRLANSDQSWLASPVPEAPTTLRSWIDPALPTLPEARVRRVTVTHGDGQVLTMERDQPGDSSRFRLTQPPEGADAGAVPRALPAGLVFVSFDEVRPATDMNWSDADAVIEYTA
ncbi:MAG: DUF4340 domain-containing protein, partial [Sphingomonadales bacterium]